VRKKPSASLIELARSERSLKTKNLGTPWTKKETPGIEKFRRKTCPRVQKYQRIPGWG